MTRVTSFGFGKRQYVQSSAEEQADRAEPAAIEEDKGEGSSSGKAKGWGKDPEIVRRAQKSEQRRLDRQSTKHAGTTCFACRAKGHAAKDCPTVLLAASTDGGYAAKRKADSEEAEGGKKGLKRAKGKKGSDVAGASGRCYRCDSTEHPLSRCPRPASDGLPYASCFICLAKGHLASTCPQNPGRGIYPNGGSCKVCGSVQHRASDCPDDKRGKKGAAAADDEAAKEWRELERKLDGKGNEVVVGHVGAAEVGADEDDFMFVKRKVMESEARKPKVQKVQKVKRKEQEEPRKEVINPLLEAERAKKPSQAQPAAQPTVQTPVASTAAPAVKRKPKVVKF